MQATSIAVQPIRYVSEKIVCEMTGRQLGLDRIDIHRALKVASLSPEAQAKAHEVGLVSSAYREEKESDPVYS